MFKLPAKNPARNTSKAIEGFVNLVASLSFQVETPPVLLDRPSPLQPADLSLSD